MREIHNGMHSKWKKVLNTDINKLNWRFNQIFFSDYYMLQADIIIYCRRVVIFNFLFYFFQKSQLRNNDRVLLILVPNDVEFPLVSKIYRLTIHSYLKKEERLKTTTTYITNFFGQKTSAYICAKIVNINDFQ